MIRHLLPCSAVTLAAALAFAPTASAQDVATTRADIEATVGGVPTFVTQVAASALPGLWLQTKALEFSDDTALDARTKALISLAVAAQIPCSYCVWSDTNAARANGATDEQIAEAVAIAGLTRNWSTNFHGLQVDMETFRMEMGGE
jgi:AhpD family alkylhydroperoxidase